MSEDEGERDNYSRRTKNDTKEARSRGNTSSNYFYLSIELIYTSNLDNLANQHIHTPVATSSSIFRKLFNDLNILSLVIRPFYSDQNTRRGISPVSGCLSNRGESRGNARLLHSFSIVKNQFINSTTY